ncbi:MAG TPA: FkbM family methyltransferase [Opitutaceae bacterium]|nr:FkbM family methyltransferase [Opitutaceae bacterium]
MISPDPATPSVLSFQQVKAPGGALRVEFLRELAARLPITTFVETGTYLGESTAAAAAVFPQVETIELSSDLAAKAIARFRENERVRVHQGDSATMLRQIIATLRGPTLFWLDGHYSEGITARAAGNTPILEELDAIRSAGLRDAVILVDDLRLFDRPTGAVASGSSLTGYPTANELHHAVLAIDPGYQFFVYGDVALAVPSAFPCAASPLLQALTISRLYDGQNLPIAEVLEAEAVVGQARGLERAAIDGLPAIAQGCERHGLGLHYRLWQALALVAEGRMGEACSEFYELARFGFRHWRAYWYQAVALHLAGDNQKARAILRELTAAVPDFAPAKALLANLAEPPATPTAQPAAAVRPTLSPAQDAVQFLAELGLQRDGTPLRLHLGCGEQHFAGYVNIDYPPSEHTCQTKIGADVFADITRLRLRAGSVDEIRLHHVFEHFKRSDALAMLIIWHEALKVGGRLHIETPDIDGCARQLVSDIPFSTKQVVLRHCFGSQEAGWAIHYDGWSDAKYRHVLERLGFRVQTKTWRWPHPPHLANVEAMAEKIRPMTREALLAAADEILAEYITADVPSERGMCEVWRSAMRDFLASSVPTPCDSAPMPTEVSGPKLAVLDAAATRVGFDNDDPASNGEYRVARALIQPGQIVLDVGANVGDWSRFVLRAAAGVELHAFEPTPTTFARLNQNLAGTGARLHPVALSNGTGEKVLYQLEDQDRFSGMNSFYRRPGEEARLGVRAIGTSVAAQSLDSFLDAQRLPAVDFLKIDTEGAEVDVLRGAERHLASGAIKVIQFEYGGTYRDAGVTLAQAFQLFTKAGYRVFRIAGEGLVPIPVWQEGLENYRYANYLALAPGAHPHLFHAGTQRNEAPVSAAPTVVAVKLQGGMGNQMFQFAAGLALARRTGARLVLDRSFLLDRTPRPNFTYRNYDLDLFELPEDCEVVNALPGSTARALSTYQEPHFHFDPRFETAGPNTYLDGYWQSPRYFGNSLGEIQRTFRQFRVSLTGRQQTLLDEIRGRNSVCLNVRRTDYVTNPAANACHGVCSEGYFQNAVAHVQDHVPGAHFYIFSDDIDWCRSANLVNGAPCTVVSHDYAGERFGGYLQLMMACRHFIIPNSSFAWWAAFLGAGPESVVVAPTPWFNDRNANYGDLTLARWHLIDRLAGPREQVAADATASDANPRASRAGSNRRPLVSVVVNCHNYAEYLPGAVTSVLDQTFRDFEIVIVDDGSTDDSAAVAQRLIDSNRSGIAIRLLRLADVGPTAARSHGIAQSQGKYFVPLDADDLMAPGFLTATVPVLEADKAIGFAYVDTVYFGDTQHRHHQPEYDFERLATANFISYCSLVRREAFDAAGGYDPENWGYYEDWDLWIRLGEAGWYGRHVSEPLFRYRHHFASSLSYFARRLDPVYRAYVVSRHPGLHSPAELREAQRLVAEMPAGWQGRPPFRDRQRILSALKADPRNRHLRYFLALTQHRTGDRAGAIATLEALLVDEPTDALARSTLHDWQHEPAPSAAATPPAIVPETRRADASLRHQGPTVSVITPCYRQAEFLGEAVDSVVQQTFTDWELIIVNDGSPDETSRVARELIARHPDRRIRLIEQENRGLAGARNAGIQVAAGKYILPLDADDKIHPEMLAKTVGLLEANPGIGIAYTDYVYFGHQTQRLFTTEYNFKTLCTAFNQFTCTSLYRREAWLAVGGYNPNMVSGYEDWDFWIGCGDHGFVGRRIPEVLFYYRTKARSMVSDAKDRHAALFSRIVLNHPHLYPPETVRQATEILAGSGLLSPTRPAPGTSQHRALVSICIPTYNGEEFLAEAVTSAARQTYPAIEIVISDDGSNDRTVAIAESILTSSSRPWRIVRHQRHGLVGNWRRCISEARGKYIKFLFQDDVLEPECVAELVAVAERDPEIGLVFSPRKIERRGGANGSAVLDAAFRDAVDVHQAWARLDAVQPGAQLLQDPNLLENPINKVGEPTTVLLVKSAIETVGGFDSELKQLVDVEMWLRIMTRYKVGFVDRVLSCFRLHEKQTTQANLKAGLIAEDWRRFYAKLATDASFAGLPPHHRATAAERCARLGGVRTQGDLGQFRESIQLAQKFVAERRLPEAIATLRRALSTAPTPEAGAQVKTLLASLEGGSGAQVQSAPAVEAVRKTSPSPVNENVDRLLAAHAANPRDLELQRQVSELRKQIAGVLRRTRPSELPTLFRGALGKVYRRLLSGGPQENGGQVDIAPAADAWAAPDLNPGPLLAAMLEWPAYRIGAPLAFEKVPEWMIDDYLDYILAVPPAFGRAGEAEDYARYRATVLDAVIRLTTGVAPDDRVMKIATHVAMRANYIPLYCSRSNTKDLMANRARLLEYVLTQKGATLDGASERQRPIRDRIRVGYLNAHFGPQTETHVTLPTLQLDRARFEVRLFTLRATGSALETHCRSLADSFVVLPAELEAQAKVIRDAELDVLIVGTNVTAVTNQIALLTLYRLAPLQLVSYCSPMTTGMRHVDGYLTGSLIGPESVADQFTEELVVCDGAPGCLDYSHEVPATKTFTRRALGLAEDDVVFLNAAACYKIPFEVVDGWARVLRAVDHSRLVLMPFNPNWSNVFPVEPFERAVFAALARHGVARERVLIIPSLPSRSDVKEIEKLADVYLDTFPFSGSLSVIDPLELGIPVVAQEGTSPRARAAAALLRAIGMEELITTDDAGYVATACRLGDDAGYRREIRAKIGARMQRGPGFLNPAAYGAQLGKILESLVRRRGADCRTAAPVLAA